MNSLITFCKNRFNKAAAPGLVFAGAWYRLFAFVIDFPLSITIAMAFVMMLQIVIPGDPLMLKKVVGNTLAIFFFQFLYFSIFEASHLKATPGKRFLKLRVTDTRGKKLSYLRSAIRTAMKSLIFLSFGIVILWIFVSKRHQTGYDRFSNTIVMRKLNESFLPIRLHKWHQLVVILLTLFVCIFTIRIVNILMAPRIELITSNLSIRQSLKKLEPAQKIIEAHIKSKSGVPEAIDSEFLPNSKNETFIYERKHAGLTIIFNSNNLINTELALSPQINDKTKDVIWACKTLNVPIEVTPETCTATFSRSN